MEKANYSEYPAHKQLHVDFIAKLKGISCPVSDDSVHFAKEWLALWTLINSNDLSMVSL